VGDAVQGGGSIEPGSTPDTIAGALEIADPVLGERAATAVRETGGDASAVPDDDALAAAVEASAAAGVEVGPAGGVGLAAVSELVPVLGTEATVVVINPTAGGTESDVLRSHLMGQGI
jgi:threonine synthase